MAWHWVKASNFCCTGQCKNGPLSGQCLVPRRWTHCTDTYMLLHSGLFNPNFLVEEKSDCHKMGEKSSRFLYINPILLTWRQTTCMKQTQEEIELNTLDFFTWNWELLLCLQGFRGKNITWKWFLPVCGWLSLSCFLSGRWFMVIRNFPLILSQLSPGDKVLPGIFWPLQCSSLLICWWKVNEPRQHKASGFESIIAVIIHVESMAYYRNLEHDSQKECILFYWGWFTYHVYYSKPWFPEKLYCKTSMSKARGVRKKILN